MTFIVDSSDWAFAGLSSNEIESLLENALEFVETSVQRGEEVLIGENLQIQSVYDSLSLWDLFGPSAPLHDCHDLRQELAAWLGKADLYFEAYPWPDNFDMSQLSIDDMPDTENHDVLWAHCWILEGNIVACFRLNRSQVSKITSRGGTSTLHFVSSDGARKEFWREMIKNSGSDIDQLIHLAAHAFPQLHFVEGALQSADRLGGGYIASRPRLMNALSILNDSGAWALTYPPPAVTPDETTPVAHSITPNDHLVGRRFHAFGLNAAPEHPNVRLNRSAREARETRIGERTLYCEWHIKLEPHRNRIHFHGPVAESNNKLVIGMIHEHLPLPG